MNGSFLVWWHERLADLRIALVAGLVVTVLVAIMTRNVDSAMVTSFQTAFTKEAADAVVQRWGTERFAAFKAVMWLDFVFPTAYAVLLVGLIARFSARAGAVRGRDLALFVLPFGAALADHVENLLLLDLLADLHRLSPATVLLASLASTLKMVLLAIAVLAALWLAIARGVRRLRRTG